MNDEPSVISGPALEPGGAALELYVEESVLGQDSRFLRETSVSFGQPWVVDVPTDRLPSPRDEERPDLDGMRVLEIVLPFDLEEPPDGCRYTETTVRMTFDDDQIRAMRLSRPTVQDGQERVDDAMLDTRGGGAPPADLEAVRARRAVRAAPQRP